VETHRWWAWCSVLGLMLMWPVMGLAEQPSWLRASRERQILHVSWQSMGQAGIFVTGQVDGVQVLVMNHYIFNHYIWLSIVKETSASLWHNNLIWAFVSTATALHAFLYNTFCFQLTLSSSLILFPW
jgi:hypothetical protein